MNRTKLQTIATAISTRGDVVAAIDDALVNECGVHWNKYLARLRNIARGDYSNLFSVFARDGNGKLPFLAFSSLPGQGFCPGAGDCLQWCYSFKAWRYPAAFCRQAQNSLLLQSESGRAVILSALDKFEQSEPLDFRLYVDGDFNDAATLDYWMKTLVARPWLRCYGYSKSFSLLLDYAGQWPDNYLVNLSGGHNADSVTLARVRELPIVRGEFLAVSIGRKVKSSDHGTRETNKALRDAFGRKAFTCPGKCGDCTPRGHACGSRRFAGIPVIIAVH